MQTRTVQPSTCWGRGICPAPSTFANPSAPRKPTGTQQASVESAARMTAAGAPSSRTFIGPPLCFLRQRQRLGAVPRRAPHLHLNTACTLGQTTAVDLALGLHR